MSIHKCAHMEKCLNVVKTESITSNYLKCQGARHPELWEGHRHGKNEVTYTWYLKTWKLTEVRNSSSGSAGIGKMAAGQANWNSHPWSPLLCGYTVITLELDSPERKQVKRKTDLRKRNLKAAREERVGKCQSNSALSQSSLKKANLSKPSLNTGAMPNW